MGTGWPLGSWRPAAAAATGHTGWRVAAGRWTRRRHPGTLEGGGETGTIYFSVSKPKLLLPVVSVPLCSGSLDGSSQTQFGSQETSTLLIFIRCFSLCPSVSGSFSTGAAQPNSTTPEPESQTGTNSGCKAKAKTEAERTEPFHQMKWK